MAKIDADDVVEFIDKAHQKFGANDLGETKADVQPTIGSFKDGKIIGLKFELSIDSDFAEVGGGKPEPAHKAAIQKVAGIVKAHEKAHEAGYTKAFAAWNAKKVAKALMDQTFKDKAAATKAIEDALDDIKERLKKACLALHAKEGLVDADVQKDGTIKIRESAAGRKGCE